MPAPEVAAPVDTGPTSNTPDVPVAPPKPWGGQTIDPSAPANAPTMFTGSAMASVALKVVYPLDGSLHPVNILDVTVQWQGTGKSAVYRLRFTNALGTLDVYTTCAKAECVYVVPQTAWRAMADANRDNDVTLTVASPGNGTVQTSPPIRVHFSPASVAGGLYYWSTQQQSIYRLTFGQGKAGPYINTAGCHGCHNVSRDGSRISWLDGEANTATIRVAPTTALKSAPPSPPNDYPNMPALNSDGTRLLLSDGQNLSVYDAATFTMLSTARPDGLGADESIRFFEWSPDGKTIAATVGTATGESPSNNLYFDHSGIDLIAYENGKFGPLRPLVLAGPGGTSSYYPSWSPDGKWIVFTSAAQTPVSPPFLGTYDNLFGRLRLIAASGGPIYDLRAASQKENTTTSWPKFSPFTQLGGQLLFIGFSSKADYGFLLRNSVAANSQLWFAAIDLRKLATGDPSWAPIWLPFQEVTQSNHLPYWTEAIQCLGPADCGQDGVCKDGKCQPTIVIP